MLKHFSYSSVLSQKILTIAVENNLSTKMHFLKESKQNNNLEVKIVLLFYLLHKRPIVFTFRGIHVSLGNYWMVTKYFERCKNQLRTWTSLVTQTVKKSTYNVGHQGSIPGLGRLPGEGHGNSLQCSCLDNSTDRGAWWATVQGVAKSWTQLSD